MTGHQDSDTSSSKLISHDNNTSPKESVSPGDGGCVVNSSPQGPLAKSDEDEDLGRERSEEQSVEDVISKWKKLLGPDYEVYVSSDDEESTLF